MKYFIYQFFNLNILTQEVQPHTHMRMQHQFVLRCFMRYYLKNMEYILSNIQEDVIKFQIIYFQTIHYDEHNIYKARDCSVKCSLVEIEDLEWVFLLILKMDYCSFEGLFETEEEALVLVPTWRCGGRSVGYSGDQVVHLSFESNDQEDRVYFDRSYDLEFINI